MKKVAVIGIGSYQHEDQLGWLVIDELQKKCGNNRNLILFKSKGNGLDWIDVTADVDEVFFIDAVKSGRESGFIHAFNIDSDTDVKNCALGESSHSVNIVDSILIANNIGLLKLPVKFIGVEIRPRENVGTELFDLIIENILSNIE